MAITPVEAASALADVARSKRKLLELRGYSGAGSILIAWGLVWLVGHLVSQFYPEVSLRVWGVGWLAALTWTLTRPRQPGDRRALATWLVLTGLVALIIALLRADVQTAAMLLSLVVAASYLILGIWAGYRFVALGSCLAAVTIVAWTLWADWLFLCLGLGGGATLILGGLWLRRA